MTCAYKEKLLYSVLLSPLPFNTFQCSPHTLYMKLCLCRAGASDTSHLADIHRTIIRQIEEEKISARMAARAMEIILCARPLYLHNHTYLRGSNLEEILPGEAFIPVRNTMTTSLESLPSLGAMCVAVTRDTMYTHLPGVSILPAVTSLVGTIPVSLVSDLCMCQHFNGDVTHTDYEKTYAFLGQGGGND